MELNSSVSAIVTGGASGLGEATIRALASHGVKVAIFDMQKDKGEKVAGEVPWADLEVVAESYRPSEFLRPPLGPFRV